MWTRKTPRPAKPYRAPELRLETMLQDVPAYATALLGLRIQRVVPETTPQGTTARKHEAGARFTMHSPHRRRWLRGRFA